MVKIKKLPPVSVRLDPDVRQALDELAKADERSLSSYINRLCRQHLEALKGRKR